MLRDEPKRTSGPGRGVVVDRLRRVRAAQQARATAGRHFQGQPPGDGAGPLLPRRPLVRVRPAERLASLSSASRWRAAGSAKAPAFRAASSHSAPRLT
jgi:hypothetical protein